MAKKLKIVGLLVMLAGISACGMPMDEFDIMPPQVSRISHTYKQLTSLPAPKGKIRVSVYNFRDQTGQYKPLPNVSSFSTAVTQGAVNMLLEALNKSNWFIPVERDGLQSLLTERKIISASKRNGEGEKNANGLPPLEWANVILQGGITAYETNTMTGGFGAKYWGLGGSMQYRQDQVTVHLRAVDVRTGRILKSVSTTKTILSHEVDVGLYRFLTFKKLLEIEAGYSHNEPVQMCVAAAIEKAVIAMVVEGVLDGLWYLNNPEDINSPVIKDYQEETQRVAIHAELKAAAAQAAADRKAAIDEAAYEKLRQAEAEYEAERAETARQQAEKEAQLTAEREEAQRRLKEIEEAKLEAERKAQEMEAARWEAEQKAQQEEQARLEAERKAQEEEAARQEAEEKARLEAERQAQEMEAARLEAELMAKQEEEARLEAERKAQEMEAARLEAERKAQEEEAARIEAERKAQEEEAARLEAERKAQAEEAARLEAERRSQETTAPENQTKAAPSGLESNVAPPEADQAKPVDTSFLFSTPTPAVADGQEAQAITVENVTLKKWEPVNIAR